MKIIDHMQELRIRIFIVLVTVVSFFFFGVFLSTHLIRLIIDYMAFEGVRLVTLSPVEFIYVQIKMGLVISLFLASPIILYQALMFLLPGIKRREKIAISYALPFFLLLFLLGGFFGIIFVRIALGFLADLPMLAGVENMWSIMKFIDFILTIIFMMGIVFQLPLLLILLKKLKLVNLKKISAKRPYIYAGAFVLAAILTPPDVVTQVLLALPLIILFELGVLLNRLF